MTVRISPSLLSADFARLGDEIADVERAGADLLHLDLMDGRFVPNLTFGPPVVRAIASVSRVPLDAHLMVETPDPLLAELAEAGVRRLAVHVETCPHLHRTLDSIRSHGAEAGVAVNPATALGVLEQALSFVDFVLVMSVDPGFGGQAFIPQSVDRIRRLRDMIGERPIDVSVDGGVDPGTAPALVAAGASTLIAGSAVFGRENRRAAITELRRAAQGAT